jgi:hypothetical protein
MHINIVQETEYTRYNDNNENIVILENCRTKKIKFGLIMMEKYMLQNFDYGLKIEMSSAMRDGYIVLHSPIEQRRK